jgi:hypothetical protein
MRNVRQFDERLRSRLRQRFGAYGLLAVIDIAALVKLENLADRAVRRLDRKREPAKLSLAEYLARKNAAHEVAS